MPSQKPRHVLTTEERRRGQAAQAATRREQGKPFRQRLAEKLDERAEEITEQLIAAGDDDWRALVAALDQAFGKPTERRELTGADGGPVEVEDRSARLEDVLAVIRAATEDGGGTAGDEVAGA